MEFSNHQNMNELLGLSGDINKYTMKFKEDILEKNYIKQDETNQLNKSKIHCGIAIFLYIWGLCISIYLYKYLSKIGIACIIGMVVETLLFILILKLSKRENLVMFLKYLRFLFFYGISIYIVISYYDTDVFKNLRVSYATLLFINLFYLYFIDFNYIFLIFIPVTNASLLIILQKYQYFGDINISIDIALISIFYFFTFFIKKTEIINKKQGFYNSFKNCIYIDYTKNMIDVLNNMIISINKKNVLFINKYTQNYLDKKINFYNDAESKLNSNEGLLVKSENNLIISNSEKLIHSFFKSMKLDNNDILNKILGKSLSEIIDEIFDIDNNQSINYKRIGYFTIPNNENEEHFDVYIRKLKFKEDILEILIYDITDIKNAERRNIESKYKQKILAKIAHEFKTPLINIISLIQRIVKNRDINIKSVLFHIENLSNYVLFLVSDIVQYVSESINLRISKSSVKLREILDFSVNVLNTLIECNDNKINKIKTSLEIDNDLDNLIINTDENRFKQLMLNFISNSVKFTESGLITIKAKLSKDKKILKISVSDTGIGIKDDEKHLIFQENVQLHNKNDKNFHGSGLGLSIVKNLANILNLHVGFKSEYGKGSSFFIKFWDFSEMYLKSIKLFKLVTESVINSVDHCVNFLPNNNLPEVEDIKSTPRIRNYYDKNLILKEISEIMIENTISFHYKAFPEKNNIIVIVDDHKLVRETTINLISSILLTYGMYNFEFAEASDGIDLLKLIKSDIKHKIKCIFLDENMEYLNGSEVVKIIRYLESRKKVPSYNIISTTAHDDYETKKTLQESGFNQVIPKPCSKSLLIEIIKNLKIAED